MGCLLSGCFNSSAASLPTEVPSRIEEPARSSTPTTVSDRSIRQIDFKNFTYPWTKEQGAPETFDLKGGKNERKGSEEREATLRSVEYGDVTGDGLEEAMISIYPWSGGNCQCYMVYIYSLENGKPKLLWNFDTFDRAEGGFKRAYAENGKLVIELFGDNKFENGEWSFSIAPGKFKGLCCPTTYNRFRFGWDGGHFVLTGPPELFDYDYKPGR